MPTSDAEGRGLSPLLTTPDLDAAGDPLPPIGSHVTCRRRSDGKHRAGLIEENSLGLFLLTDEGERVVLTASNWDVVVSGRG